MKKLRLILILLALTTSCDKSKLPGDSFVFGLSFGECSSNCTTFFLIKNNKLFKDQNENTERLRFKLIALSDEKFNKARPLLDSFPEFLLENTGTIGQPGTVDQGTVFLRLKKNGTVTEWKIDPDTSKIPIPIRKYIARVIELTAFIN